MAVLSRGQVPPVTVVLSVVSLALVFAAAGGVVPSTSLPHPGESVVAAIPHVNVALSLSAMTAIVLGWRWIRRGEIARHRLAMLTAFALFATFLTLYLYRLVVMGGPQPFDGPETIRTLLYLPVLTIHILLAIVCVPLLYYVLLLAIATPLEELPRTRHRSVGRIAATLWLVSFGLGIVVYILLHTT